MPTGLAVHLHVVGSAEALVATPLTDELAEAAAVLRTVLADIFVLVCGIATVLGSGGCPSTLLDLLEGPILARVASIPYLTHDDGHEADACKMSGCRLIGSSITIVKIKETYSGALIVSVAIEA